MNAILNLDLWGWGVVASPAHEGVGSITDERFAELNGQSAKEAIDTLEGNFAQDNPLDDGDVTFPGPISEAFYWSDADVCGIQGPVGSGKTTTLMKSRLRRAIMMPRSTKDGVRRYKMLFIRETYRQLWSTSIPSYLETFPKEMGKWSGGRGDPVTHVINFEDEHGRVEFIAEFMAFGDDIVASMRGVQTTDIGLNEADTMPDDILTVGIGRIDRWPSREHFDGLPQHLRSYGQIVCDFNAPDEDNYTFKVFHDEEERERIAAELSASLPPGTPPIQIKFFNQPGYGEPGCENLQNLSSTYYPRQIAAMKLAGRGDMIQRMVYNKVVYLRVGDPVWKDHFNRRIHVSDAPLVPVPGVPLRIGLDQGFKGAAVIAQCLDDTRWRIYGELHLPDKRLMASAFGALLLDLLEERFPNHRVEAGWGDMAGEHGSSTATDENDTWNLLVGKAAGFFIRPQRIGTNRITPRLEAVRAALDAPLSKGEPGLVIDPSCKFLRRGFEARYVWTEETNKSGDKRKVPDKSFTEANVHDALQYLLLSEHLADGTSPYARRMPDNDKRGRMGHNGGPSLSGNTGGLQSGWDVTSPYGE
ncbi:MAG: hypothetical protein ACPG61_14770 [Paracoccaceae bacterium]